MREEEYFIVEVLFPNFQILNERHQNKTVQDFKKIRELNIQYKRLINHGMPMTYEEKTAIEGDYDNDVELSELEAYFQRSLKSIIKILRDAGIEIPPNEITLAYEKVEARREKEGVDSQIYETKLFNPEILEDFNNWHPVYEIILKEFIRQNNVENLEELKELLREMAVHDKNLHGSYQNNAINISYDEIEIQLAYLFRYSSIYINDLVKILNELEIKEIIADKNKLKLTFIGAGPGFESLSFIDWMVNEKILSYKKTLELDLIDKDLWCIGRRIIKGEIQKILSSEDLNQTTKFNEIQSDFMHMHEEELCSDLLIFQNCLNEILTVHQADEVKKKVLDILSLMSKGSYLLFIDRDKYDSINTFLKDLSLSISSMSQFIKIKEESTGRLQQVSIDQIPKILEETIYNETLSPSMNTTSTFFAVKVI